MDHSDAYWCAGDDGDGGGRGGGNGESAGALHTGNITKPNNASIKCNVHKKCHLNDITPCIIFANWEVMRANNEDDVF